MKFLVPLTGTLLTYGPTGDPDDPVRVIDLDLGDVEWHAVGFDLENGLVEIEVSGAEAAMLKIKQLLEGNTVQELYDMSGSPRLKKPGVS